MAGQDPFGRFGQAAYGVEWAAAELPQGRVVDGRIFAGDLEVKLATLRAEGEDNYVLASGPGRVTVRSGTAIGAIAGLLELGRRLRSGEKTDAARHLRFRTRNYKHEIRLGADTPRSILSYTDEVWETLCRQIVRHQFNGLTLYAGYHPFEYILDYKEFPYAASRPEAHRMAVRETLNRGLAIAHRYGLKTFMQHYTTHFTPQLAEHLKLGAAAGERIADVGHPEIDRYCRWCYREIFRQVPDLDGLYFNFESAPHGAWHVLETAIPEFNAMARKPIAVFRLWGVIDPKGIQAIYKAYKGRKILGHKIPDTDDTYYLPVADSHVMEWHKILPQAEFMFLVGPCHNCGTNLCEQVWGDYAFVQTLLGDAVKKGADSISFHTINEFFSSDVATAGVFDEREKAMSRFNLMHLQAVADFVNGRRMTPDERAAALAARCGVGGPAGRALLEAVEASSQLVLLVYQQFCGTSSWDGFLNVGRFSHIQDPFLIDPANSFNNQASRMPWRMRPHFSWILKTIDTKVAPDNFLQHIIDYVDPSKRKAVRNPRVIADLLAKHSKASAAALKKYERLAGKEKADELAPHLRNNAALAAYAREEILAGIAMYPLYFATSKAAMVAALKKGLKHLRALPPILEDKAALKSMMRVVMFNRLDPKFEIRAVEDLLATIQAARFPMAAMRDYVESRRVYNETRRWIRPQREFDQAAIEHIVRQHKKAIAKAEGALRQLAAPADAPLAAGVRAWLEFLESELAATVPPTAVCGREPGEFHRFRHDHCLRSGEYFTDDFLGFFRPLDYLRLTDQGFQVWHTDEELVLHFREAGVDMAQRKARWAEYRGTSSDSFVTRVFVDSEGKGLAAETFIAWPMGEGVSVGRRPFCEARTRFTSDETSWQLELRLAYSLFGRTPKKGDAWGLNVTFNPAVASVAAHTWAATYDSNVPRLYGKVKFA
jgi:hypothetical protein